MNMSQSILCLKANLPMLHGEKGSFIFANQMAINYHLDSHCSKNGTNNFLVIVVFYFLGDRLRDAIEASISSPHPYSALEKIVEQHHRR
jgi:hypothetical protein